MDQNSCRKYWKNGEGVVWEVMTWSEEWTDKEKSCKGAMGPKLANFLLAATD